MLALCLSSTARRNQGQSGQGSPPLADVSSDALKLLTPRAKQVIFLAGEEMKSQGEQSIRPTHLLLGLMNEGEGIGAGLLRRWASVFLQARTAWSLPLPIRSALSAGVAVHRSPASSQQRSALLQAAHPSPAPSSVITV